MRITVDDILNYLNEFGPTATINEYETKVLDMCSPELSYFFAANVPGCNLKAHERVVKESGNIQCIYQFASIKGADTKGLLYTIRNYVEYTNPSHDGLPDLTAEALTAIGYANPSRDFQKPKSK